MLSTAVVVSALTFITLWANSADDKLIKFFSYFSENRFNTIGDNYAQND